MINRLVALFLVNFGFLGVLGTIDLSKEDVPMCWINRNKVECKDVMLMWIVDPPKNFTSLDTPVVKFALQTFNGFQILPTKHNLIPHANIHSCESGIVSVCEPFIKPIETGKITVITHNEEQKGNVTTFTTALKLPVGNWEIMAHMYFFDEFGNRYDVANSMFSSTTQFVKEKEQDEGIRIANLVVGAFLSVLCLISALICFLNRETEYFKAGSFVFLEFFCLGCLLLSATLFIFVFPLTSISCICYEWFFALGFALAFGSLLVKNYRVAKIFTNPDVRNGRVLRDSRLIFILLGIIVVFVFYLIIWTAIDPPAMVHRAVMQGDVLLIYPECSVSTWRYFMLVLQLALMTVGLIIAIQTRNSPKQYDESKYIAMATYNWCILRVVFVIIEIVIQLDSEAQLILALAFLVLTIPFMLSVIFLPKINQVKGGVTLSRASRNTTNKPTSVNESFYRSLIKENQELKDKLAKLKKEHANDNFNDDEELNSNVDGNGDYIDPIEVLEDRDHNGRNITLVSNISFNRSSKSIKQSEV